MKLKIKFLLFIYTVVSFPVFSQRQDAEPISQKREHLNLDAGWRFALGNATDSSKDFNAGTGYFSYFAKTGYGDGASATQFEDRTWREVDLPHDWADELPFSSSASHSHGYRTIGQKYPESSVGWYRKKITIPASDLGRKISLQFDGIHRNSIVWVNGFYVGNEKSGYASSEYDITDYLNYDGENTVAVRVDASMEEGWYYEGAGIYRHAWLNKTDRLHVSGNGTFVTSEINGNEALLTIRTNVENQNDHPSTFTIAQILMNANSQQVVSTRLENITLQGNLDRTWYQKIRIDNPTLWSLDNPYLYSLKTNILTDGHVVDSYVTTIGIRTVRFDPDKGFFLNGKSVKIKGTNDHQDHAGVGTAIPDALQEFRVKKLKEMGSNAIRTSHNPPTPELLDICDRLGMLVLDENRLMGVNREHFDLLERFMVRDRNHPSVILWSLGNEEWAIEGNEKGARITKTMQEFAQKIDSSRAFTVAVSGGWDNGSGRTVQVMGYNYIVQGNIDEHHKKFPWQCGIGTEESNTIGTRGVYSDDKANGRMAATNRMPENVGTESGWKFYAERPFLSGLFFWTGFDYRGEANPLLWPAVNSEFGIVDLCGFPKDIFYYLKSWWGDKPVMHIMPHWNWKGREGKTIKVIIYSNAEEVELVLNGKSLGKKQMPVNGHIDWDVVYMPGTLLAKGTVKGKVIVSEQVETTDVPVKLALSSDRTQLNADGRDVAIITVQLNDLKNRLVTTADNEITFSLNGQGKIIGVGNGDPASHDPEQFVDGVDRLNIVDLYYKLSDSSNYLPDTDESKNNSGWFPAFQKGYGEYDAGKYIFIRGSFTMDSLTDNKSITFYSKNLVEDQSVYINGSLLPTDLKRKDPDNVYKLDNNLLHNGINTVVFTGKPFVKKAQWEELNTNPGTIRVQYASGTWKRKLFNGYAQVLVRATKHAGDITLTATSVGMKPAILKMQSTEINPVISEVETIK